MTLRKHTLITRLPLPRLMLAGFVSMLLAGCGSGSMNNTGFTGTIGGQGSIIGTTGGDGTTGSALCTSTGLAAADLSGQCRATPQPTMGALEAVGG